MGDKEEGKKEAGAQGAPSDKQGEGKAAQSPPGPTPPKGPKEAKELAAKQKAIRNPKGDVSDEEESEVGDEELKNRTDQMINDVMNEPKAADSRAKEGSATEKKKMYRKKIIRKETEFSIFGLEEYLESKYVGQKIYIAKTLFMAIGAFAIILPSSLLLLIKRQPPRNLFDPISEVRGSMSLFSKDFKISFFLMVVFVTYCILRQMGDDFLYIVAFMFKASRRKVTQKTRTLLLVLRDLRRLLVLCLFFPMVVVVCNTFLERYKPFVIARNSYGFVGALSFWLAVLCWLIFTEKFMLKIAVTHFGNDVFKGRVEDVNFRMGIIRKLWLYVEAKEKRDSSIFEDDPMDTFGLSEGFLVHYSDFSIKTAQEGVDLVETIYAKLEEEAVDHNLFKRLFGENAQGMWEYVQLNIKEEAGKESSPISFDELSGFMKNLYQERLDLKRTLYDRDKLLDKLDFVLEICTLSLAAMLIAPIFGIDPKIYLAGIVPIIFGSGWLFADTVKDVFNNFLFLLHEHAYDVGDRIILGADHFVVLRIDLMYTTFTKEDGTVCYIPNKELIKEKIFNIRRSDLQSEGIVVTLRGDLSMKTVREIQDAVKKFLTENDKDYTGNIRLKEYTYADQKTRLVFLVEYNANFQEPGPRFKRRNAILETVKQTVKRFNLEYLDEHVE